MNCIRYICCIIGFIIALPVVSKSSGFISEVDSALARGEYEKAIRGYSELLEKEGSSPAIYINLSNAYHSFGDDGLSMVALLKGKKLDSFNKKINNNLLYLRNSISAANKSLNKDRKVDIQTDSPTFFENVKKLLITDFSPNIWAGWGAITFILFIGCIAAYFLSYNVIVRKVGFFGGMTFCLLSLIFVVLSLYSASSYEDKEYCVVIEKKCPIYKSIEIEDDNILIEVVGGTELKLEKEEDESPQGLVKVRLNKSVQGWVKKGEVEVL